MELKFWIDKMISLNYDYHELSDADKYHSRKALLKWWQTLTHKQDMKNVDLGEFL